MKRFLFVFLLLIEFFAKPAGAGVVDRSQTVFWPKHFQKQLRNYESFPVFWWDFLVKEIKTDADWAIAVKICSALKTPESSGLVLKASCMERPEDFADLIKDWAHDLPLRAPMPAAAAMLSKFNGALAQASLPTGSRDLMEILRRDPLETWQDLRDRTESKIKLKLPRENGFFFNAASKRIVIPLQMAFPPSDTVKTKKFRDKFMTEDGDWLLIGPHGSSLQNEEQIIKDVHNVSKVGTLLLILFGAALFMLRRSRVLYIVPPVLLSMAVAFGVTVLVFGSIHGLTLSFGTAIVGLALDYGLQAVFNGRSPHVWRSNLYGVLTTIVGLVVLMFSSIPLIRQMMVFSTTGLAVAFGLLYFVSRKKTSFAEPLPFSPKARPIKTAVVVALVLLSFTSAFTMKPSLDLQKFDFQDARTHEVAMWLYRTLNMRAPLFRISPSEGILGKTSREKEWADGEKIQIENLATYVPPEPAQIQNLEAWSDGRCAKFENALSPDQKKFFAPYLENKMCGKREPLSFAPQACGAVPSYVSHLQAGETCAPDWITLWIPSDDNQSAAVKEKFSDAISLKDLGMSIPIALASDLKWMAPLSIGLAALVLFVYYRDTKKAFSALIPFFTGMGLVSFCVIALKFDVSFVTIIGLVMVFGFSIDYGIFATDIHRKGAGHSPQGVWTGLTFAAVATVAGFVPLLFCKHPVLLGLGQTLTFGALGTYIGAVWGVPALLEFVE